MSNIQVSAVFGRRVNVSAPKKGPAVPELKIRRGLTSTELKKVERRMRAIAKDTGGEYLGGSVKDGKRLFNFEIAPNKIGDLTTRLESTRSLVLSKPKAVSPKTVSWPTFSKLKVG